MARNLGNGGSHIQIELKVCAFVEEAAHATKIDCWEKLLKIDIQYVSAMRVLIGIR